MSGGGFSHILHVVQSMGAVKLQSSPTYCSGPHARLEGKEGCCGVVSSLEKAARGPDIPLVVSGKQTEARYSRSVSP